MEDEELLDNNGAMVNLAKHYEDDSTSASDALMKARKTAMNQFKARNQFNTFLQETNIGGGAKYDQATFPVDMVTEALVGQFSCYLRQKVKKCETAHAYLSKMKNILEEDFKSKNSKLIELFRLPQIWFHKIRRIVSAHYLKQAEEMNTAVTDWSSGGDRKAGLEQLALGSCSAHAMHSR